MKKNLLKILIGYTFLLLFTSCNVRSPIATNGVNSNAGNEFLDEIVNKFNASKTVSQISEAGTAMIAAREDLTILLTADRNGTKMNVEFILDDSILSANVSAPEPEDMAKPIMAMLLVDCVGQIHGYPEGDTMSILNSQKIKNYTVANEGLEMKDLGENSFAISIDITKRFPLLNADLSVEGNIGVLYSIDDSISAKNNLFEYRNYEWETTDIPDSGMFWKGSTKNISDEVLLLNIRIKFYDIDKNCIGDHQFEENNEIDEDMSSFILQPNDTTNASFSFYSSDLYEDHAIDEVRYISIEDIVYLEAVS